MQSHEDSAAAEAFDALRKRAEDLTARGENLITAGAPHERAIGFTHGGFLIRRLPDDPLALRISIGEAHEKYGESSYLVFRGDPRIITTLLRRALAALDGSPLGERTGKVESE